MKDVREKFAIDGSFEYANRKILFRIIEDNKPVRLIHGVQKMSGFFNYFDGNGESIGSIAFYENYEDMSPVCVGIPEKYFVRLMENK